VPTNDQAQAVISVHGFEPISQEAAAGFERWLRKTFPGYGGPSPALALRLKPETKLTKQQRRLLMAIAATQASYNRLCRELEASLDNPQQPKPANATTPRISLRRISGKPQGTSKPRPAG
jgi:hypothetical protein